MRPEIGSTGKRTPSDQDEDERPEEIGDGEHDAGHAVDQPSGQRPRQ